MRTRIGAAAAVLVISTAAWALAQREERPRPQGVPEGVLAPAEPRVELPPIPPPADPVAVASELLCRAKSEIERLEDEKRSAEKELARVKAKIEVANAGIAKWRRLARAMSNALGESKGTDDPPPPPKPSCPLLPSRPRNPNPSSGRPPPPPTLRWSLGRPATSPPGGDVDLVIIGSGHPSTRM
jgi:hypothetical protein